MIRSWLTQSFSEQPRQKKRAPRHVDPGVNAFYWDGGAPSARQLKDISMTGAYLYTSDRWYLGTLIELMLQSASEAGEGGSKKDLSVLCRVTRHGADGLGVKFLMPTDLHRKKVEHFVEEVRKERRAARAPGRAAGDDGQTLIEFALMLPILVMLIFNAVNFGSFFFAFITVQDAARAGAQYAALGVSSAFNPAVASVADVTSVVQTALSYLPNAASATVSICQNNNGAITQLRSTAACSASATQPPADSEVLAGTATYTTVIVDVSYTYSPAVNLPSIAGWPLTVPPTTIHKAAIMRLLS